VARETGVGFSRTTSLNDEPRFIEILADTVRSAADRSR
jgi:protoheme ferro-lyase